MRSRGEKMRKMCGIRCRNNNSGHSFLPLLCLLQKWLPEMKLSPRNSGRRICSPSSDREICWWEGGEAASQHVFGMELAILSSSSSSSSSSSCSSLVNAAFQSTLHIRIYGIGERKKRKEGKELYLFFHLNNFHSHFAQPAPFSYSSPSLSPFPPGVSNENFISIAFFSSEGRRRRRKREREPSKPSSSGPILDNTRISAFA